jgi:hypothetical protein
MAKISDVSADEVELYSEICNVICRFDLDIPKEDPYKHTSPVARNVANDIMDILERHNLVNWRK